MTVTILIGDCLAHLRDMEDESVHCIVTSPPYYGLRDYGIGGQIGLEPTPDAYVAALAAVFGEARRVLRHDGTLWLNLGDSYATGAGKVGARPGGGAQGDRWSGHKGSRGGSAKQPHAGAAVGPLIQFNRMPLAGLKPKDLIGIPWMVAFALRADGWWLRQAMPWVKRNAMPESTKDRPNNACETVFLLSKSPRYRYDYEAVKRRAVAANDHDATGPGYAAPGQSAQTGSRRKSDKQRGHSRRHAGFNDRWDSMTREEQLRTRAFRNGDLFFTSLRAPHGVIGDGNKILAFDVPTQAYRGAHFATFPPTLVEPCVLAGCPAGGTVLDPFGGAGTTGLVADRLGRNVILIELNPDYAEMARGRICKDAGIFSVLNPASSPDCAGAASGLPGGREVGGQARGEEAGTADRDEKKPATGVGQEPGRRR